VRRQPTTGTQEEMAFSFVMEALTQGLYPNVFDVIREYVQNSYDAIVRDHKAFGEKDYKIRVNVTGESVFISDNGPGMAEDKIQQYRYIGFSDKPLGEAAGFRGIGKLAGISVADRVIVTSSPRGVPKRYKVVFNARDMLTEIILLRSRGRNKPLNELVREHSELLTELGNEPEHFTVVELHGIRAESRELLDPNLLRQHIGAVCPVPLNPNFQYESEVNGWLLENVGDYYYLPHYVNDEPVHKPFTNQVRDLGYYEIEEEEGGKVVAYAWACQNLGDEQLPELGPRGLVFRQKNIAIGDHQTVRTLLWETSGHLAYWFHGEIHVCDTNVVPTAERSNFEDNDARHRLVDRSRLDLVAKLTRTARKRSATANAERKREELQDLIQNAELALNRREIPREGAVYEAAKIVTAVGKVKKVSGRFAQPKRAEVAQLVEKAEGVIRQMTEPSGGEPGECGVYDLRQELDLSPGEWRLYDLFVRFIEDFLADDPDRVALAIRRLQERVLDEYGA